MKQADIRLIALDLDGTLLDSDKRLTERNAKALERAARAGIEIVPATGRLYRALPEAIRALDFVHYVISINGAELWDLRSRRTLGGAALPWARAVELMELLDGLPVIYDCYQDGWGWMSQAHYARAEDFAASPFSLAMIRQTRTPVPELKAHLRRLGREVQKLQVFFRDPALRAEALRELPARFPDLVFTSSLVNNIEINSKDATKALALTRLAAHLGLNRAQTMAFGDGLNDLDMLRAAGLGVAMGNAEPEVKAAADYVTDDCDHSGVAAALEALLPGLL